MVPEIGIRVARHPADTGVLQQLFRDYGSHLAENPTGAAGICIENFDREIASLPEPYAALLLATVDGAAAGCVALKQLAHDAGVPGGRACEMKRLWVDGRYRGLGLGRGLIVRAMDHARELGFGAMYLDTVPAAMPEANRLYDALEFERIERYNRNSVADVVFFRRPL